MRTKIFFLFKLAITAALLSYLFTKIDLHKVYTALILADWRFIALSFIASITAWYFSAWRWRTFLDPRGSELSVPKLFTFNLIGNFYGMVLPGGKLSGDAMGAYRLFGAARGLAVERIFASLIADRLLGLLTIVFLGGLLFGLGFGAAIFDGGMSRLAGVVMLMFPPVIILAMSLFGGFSSRERSGFMGRLLAAWREYFTYSGNLLLAAVLSFAAVGFSGLSLILLGISLGIPLPPGDFAAAYFLATILIAVPVTIGGIGLREGGLIYFLLRMGIGAHASSALAVLMFAVFAFLTLLGGVSELALRLKKR